MSTNAVTTRKSGQKLRNNRLNPYSSRTRRQLKDPRKKTKRKETEEERHKDEYVEEDAEETENPLPRSRLSLPNYEIAKSGPLLVHTESAPGRLAAKVPGIADFARKPSFTQHNEFENKFFKNNAKQLLNTYTKIEGDDRILLQVSCDGLAQFQQYPNLSLGTQGPVDCFVQSLFSLGLIEAGCAKEHAKQINSEGKGVLFDVGGEYLCRVFGVARGMIKYTKKMVCDSINKHTNSGAKLQITEFLKKYLKPGNATIITLYFHKYGKFTNAHYMIAYKNKTDAEAIYYFDPQQQDVLPKNKTISRTLQHLINYNKSFICEFGYYSIFEMNEPMTLLTDTCPIPFDPKTTVKIGV